MNRRSFVSLFIALLILLGTIHPASVFAASSDNWSNSTVPSVFSAKGVVYENGRYLTVGASGAVLFYTDSSVFFGSVFLDGSPNLNNIIYNDGKSVIVGDEGKIFSLSMDSERVTERFTAISNTTDNLLGIAYGDGKYVAVGSVGTIVTSPPDRRTWTQQTSNTVSDLGDVTYGNEQYVAVGSDGTIVTSANGETWMAQTSNTTNNLEGVTYGNEQYVAVGFGGTIVTSADGETWTVQTSNTTENLARVTYGNGLFVAVGSNGTIVTSSNGSNWTLRESDVTNDLYDVAYGNKTFMAVGEHVNLLYKYPNVIYMGNGNTGGDEPTDSKTYQSGESATVLGNTGSLVKNGYTFAGWNTLETGNGTSYAVDDTITMDMGNVTLYAKWTKNPTYKVTYNGNGYTSGNVPTDIGEYEENASVTVRGNT
ncbi:InlB B-repeat-containing protein, partial [Paenibacillus sp. 2TAB26]|uniref:InlB B-repeat-containing protein n=1 Tax=Paenibacillus sp. 2TAB26 TaxID=3233005 RepID=UPI003F995341